MSKAQLLSPVRTHSDIAHQYARDIVDGRIDACRWVKLACTRHIDDLKNSENDDYPYAFDVAKAERPCKFIELLPHVAGRWAARKELIKLEPWQKFIICSLFGWVKRSDGNRRFRKSYVEVSRKNGKSSFAAGIALFCLILDGEYGAQVYVGANTEKQAGHVFDPAKKMATLTPALAERYGVEVNAQSITQFSTNSKFERLIGNPGDGASPSFACVDEWHEADDSALYDTMLTGMVAREQPLLFVITTAGFNTGGPCYAMRREVERMLEGTIENDSQFGIVYTLDDGDDWTDPKVLIKCNPNWGVSVLPDGVLAEQKEAVQSPEKQNTFKTKHMCVWCSAKSSYFNAEAWQRLGDPTLSIDRFIGRPCTKGLDLASQIDIAADVTVFDELIEGVVHYFVFPRFYLPDRRAYDPSCQHYQSWVHKKLIIATGGDEIDFETIKKNILSDATKFDVKELCFDKHQALFLKQQICNSSNIEGAEIPQNAPTFSDPMKWLDGMIRSGRIHHDGNEVMTWMIGNVVAKEDANENVFPRKEKPEFKIDGVTALLNALVRIKASLGSTTDGYFEYNGF